MIEKLIEGQLERIYSIYVFVSVYHYVAINPPRKEKDYRIEITIHGDSPDGRSHVYHTQREATPLQALTVTRTIKKWCRERQLYCANEGGMSDELLKQRARFKGTLQDLDRYLKITGEPLT